MDPKARRRSRELDWNIWGERKERRELRHNHWDDIGVEKAEQRREKRVQKGVVVLQVKGSTFEIRSTK